MKVYLDLVLFINFSFDFLLLLIVSLILKRNIKLKKIFYGGIVGSLSTFLLFIKLNNLELFLYKVIISILMILITFNYKNIKYILKNILYLYIVSIILGGFIYLINCQFSYKHSGIIFFNNGFSINIILLIIISPIMLYLYKKELDSYKLNESYYYKMDIYYKDKELNLNAFLDTGNKLKDPYMGLPIIVANKNVIDEKLIDDFILVPINTVNNNSLIKCIKVKIKIDGKDINKKVLLGLSKNKLNLEGIDCIFGKSILEG